MEDEEESEMSLSRVGAVLRDSIRIVELNDEDEENVVNYDTPHSTRSEPTDESAESSLDDGPQWMVEPGPEKNLLPQVPIDHFGACDFPEEAEYAILDYFSLSTEDYEDHHQIAERFESADVADVVENLQQDEEEARSSKVDQEAFFSQACCSKECNQLFKKELVLQAKAESKENDFYCSEHVNHLHLLLLGQLSALTVEDETVKTKQGTSKDRERTKTYYMFRGYEVCRKFFSFVNNCSHQRIHHLKTQLRENGLDPKLHGRHGRAPHNATETERIEEFRMFLVNFSDVHALVLPGRVPYQRADDPDVKILPSSFTKAEVYKYYTEGCARPFSYRMFTKMWNTFCPNIISQKARTDLCSECYKNTISAGRLHGLSEEEKLSCLEKSQTHLRRVMTERKIYQELTIRLTDERELGPSPALSFKGSMHYSFDFAQQIFIPYDSQQVGPLYFLTPYKLALFGVACEPLGKFVLYIIPESASSVGKGSNLVISLLHHFLQNFGLGEEEVYFHADNCVGQNKNNYLFQYAVWRTLCGLHKRVKISFLPVGHTKFSPDLYFGCVKRAYRRSSVHSLEEVKNAIIASCGKHITPFLVADEAGKMFVSLYDWQAFFKDKKAERVAGLLENYHFQCSSSQPGKLFYKKTAESEQSSTQIFPAKAEMSSDIIPSQIQMNGLPLLRQKYLYEKIREHVKDDCKDILCPLPTEDVAEAAVEQQALANNDGTSTTGQQHPGAAEPQVPGTSKTRRISKCRYCNEEGHTNRLDRNRIPVCPKRRQDENIN